MTPLNHFADAVANFRAEAQVGLAIKNHLAQAPIPKSGPPNLLGGIPVIVTDLVPPGSAFTLSPKGDVRAIVTDRVGHFRFFHLGRFPFESRYTAGMLELARERRRRKAGR